MGLEHVDAHISYELVKPLHDMWRSYIQQLLNIVAMNGQGQLVPNPQFDPRISPPCLQAPSVRYRRLSSKPICVEPRSRWCVLPIHLSFRSRVSWSKRPSILLSSPSLQSKGNKNQSAPRQAMQPARTQKQRRVCDQSASSVQSTIAGSRASSVRASRQPHDAHTAIESHPQVQGTTHHRLLRQSHSMTPGQVTQSFGQAQSSIPSAIRSIGIKRSNTAQQRENEKAQSGICEMSSTVISSRPFILRRKLAEPYTLPF